MFENMQWYDILRVFTIFFATSALYFSTRRSLKNWHTYTRRLQELIWVMQGFLILMIEAGVEGILLDVPGGPRNVLSVIIAAVYLRAVVRQEGFIIQDKETE